MYVEETIIKGIFTSFTSMANCIFCSTGLAKCPLNLVSNEMTVYICISMNECIYIYVCV
jgi:hypothetical protein